MIGKSLFDDFYIKDFWIRLNIMEIFDMQICLKKYYYNFKFMLNGYMVNYVWQVKKQI